MPTGKIDLSKMSYPGMRTAKTALTVTLVMVLYRLVLGPDDWVFGAPMACIAAVICLQDTVGKTLEEGTARVVGTFIGGGSAVLVLMAGLRDHNFALFAIASGLCLIVIIHVFNILNQHNSIAIGCVVFLNVVINASGVEPRLLALSSIVNTLVGIAAAYSVNKFVYAPDSRGAQHEQPMFRVRLKKKSDKVNSTEPDTQRES